MPSTSNQSIFLEYSKVRAQTLGSVASRATARHGMDTVWTQYGHSMDTVWTQYGHSMDKAWTPHSMNIWCHVQALLLTTRYARYSETFQKIGLS